MPQIRIRAYKCNRCGRGPFTSRAGGKPKRCPTCRSPYFDSPRVRQPKT